MAAKKSTAVAAAKSTDVGSYDYGEYSEFQDKPESDELLIPFLSILQPMSPEIVEADEDAPANLKPGNFVNSVTGEITTAKDGLIIQPVIFQSMVVEWIPREKGGGIANRYSLHDPYVRNKIKENGNSVIGLKEGENDLVETVYVYCNLLDPTGTEVLGFGVLPVTKTSLQPIKGFRTALQMIKGKPPLFAFRALLSTERKTNESGTWWRLKVSPFGGDNWSDCQLAPSEDNIPLLDAGAGLARMVQSGEAKADLDNEAKTGGPSEEKSSKKTGNGDMDAEDPPF